MMKKLVLVVTLVVGGMSLAHAQCTPNPNYISGPFGVYPDTTSGLLNGEVGVFYTDTLHFLVPSNSQDIDPSLPAATIDSVQVTAVTGLPPGIVSICNSQTGAPCTLIPNMIGCALIEGTPTQQGAFPITIDVLGFAFLERFRCHSPSLDITSILVSLEIEDVNGVLSSVKNVPKPVLYGDRDSIHITKTGYCDDEGV